jgi:hypothetical protein
VRTPTNLVAHMLNRTTGAYADLAKIGYNKTKAMITQDETIMKKMAEEGYSTSEAAGRLTVGVTVITSAIITYANGSLQGGGPADPEVNKAWRAAGNMPYSIQILGKRYDYRRMDPWAPILGIVCDIGDAFNRADEEGQNFLEALSFATIFGITEGITSRAVLTGLARFSNVLSDPDRYGESWLEQSITTVGPMSGFAGQIISDDVVHEIRGVLDAIRVKYGLTGEDSNNFFGEKVEQQFTALGDPVDKNNREPWAPMVAWKDSKNRKNQDIYTEMSRLNHGWQSYGKERKGLVLQNYQNESGDSAEQRANELMGTVRLGGKTLTQALRSLMRSSRYQKINPDHFEGGKSPRVELVRNIHRAYKERVWKALLREFPNMKRAHINMKRIKSFANRGIEIPEELLEAINF